MRVLVVSTHRSDKGHYDRLLRVLRADARFRVSTWNGQSSELVLPTAELFGAAVVLGDRVEMLQAAVALVEARVPLVHIHGGEHTYGSLDERWRYAITAIADWHCVAYEHAKWEVERYLITGEWGAGPRKSFTDVLRKTATCVVVTGAPGLDDIRERGRLENLNRIVVLYNPIADLGSMGREIEAIHYGVEGMSGVVWFRPNGDRGSDLIVAGHKDVRDRNELDQDAFRDELAAAHVIVGNSSAGIIEAPSLGTWCVNVGERQAGRVRAGNVIDVPADAAKIRAAIEVALSRPRFVGVNPYAHPQGKACEAIRDVLLGFQNSSDNRGYGELRYIASRGATT